MFEGNHPAQDTASSGYPSSREVCHEVGSIKSLPEYSFTMFFEEEVRFLSPGDARDFIRFLKTRGVKTHVSTRYVEQVIIAFKGPVSAFEAMIDDLESNPPAPGDSAADQEDTVEVTPDSISRFKNAVKKVRTGMESLSVYEAGDRIQAGGEEGREELTAGLPESATADERVRYIADRIIPVIHLQASGGIESRDDGLYLTRKVVPGEEVVSLTDPFISTAVDACAKKHGVTPYTKIEYLAKHVVTTGPELYFETAGEELEEMLSEAEMDEDDYQEFIQGSHMKRVLIPVITGIIGGRKMSVDELADALAEFSPEGQDDREVLISIDRELVPGLVGELRKAGVLEGTDQKIRCKQGSRPA